MRRELVLGVGLAALVGGTASGQFAADRAKSAPPATPTVGGFQPVAPAAPASPTRPAPGHAPLYSSSSAPPSTSAYVPPAEAIRPAGYAAPAASLTPAPVPENIEIPTAIPKDHQWLIKPEHGEFFILVKSYVRPAKDSREAAEDKGWTALQLAETLANDVRQTYRVQAFLYEFISEERKAEMRTLMAARHKAQTEYLAQVEAMRQKAKLQGMDFLRPDNTLHVLKHSQKDQIGVLVGGFQSEEDALKALAKLKTWPAPKNEVLLDKGLILTDGDGKQSREAAFLNPYATAFVVPNPSVARERKAQGLDPFLVKLNEGNPYSLLGATKGWTLAVKSFTAPVELVSANSDTGLMKKFNVSKGADVLAASGEQAEALAKALRQMRGPGTNGQSGQPLNLEAFVLHTRSSSMVTVGQFDGPNDPALAATKQVLMSMKLNLSVDQMGTRPVANAPSLFDNVAPMPIPKP